MRASRQRVAVKAIRTMNYGQNHPPRSERETGAATISTAAETERMDVRSTKPSEPIATRCQYSKVLVMRV
jgi:hypothetical protein